MSDRPVLDRGALARLVEWGGEGLRAKMIDLFLEHAPTRLAEIREGFGEGNAERVERGAHSLKSSAGNVGATQLQEICQEMEARASDGELAGLDGLLPELERACSEALEALRAVRDGEGE